MTSSLLVKSNSPSSAGCVLDLPPEKAGWKYVGFELYHLRPGQTLDVHYPERECLVFLIQGKVRVTLGPEPPREIGARMELFSRQKPWSVYVPRARRFHLEATTEVEFALCTAPGKTDRPPRFIPPDDVKALVRGEGTNQRFIHNVLMDQQDWADALLVTEVYTPAGHWSSYPPHKHDTDNYPEETWLEEIYYHRLNPPQGFGYQRVYTDDRTLDEHIGFENGDVVKVPRGYHPVGTPYGYELYYLNVMAGPQRRWCFKNDPAHAWMLEPRQRPEDPDGQRSDKTEPS